MNLKISFISTVLNEKKNIKKFLNSIIKQTKKPDEIIILDGGSTDGTYKILKDYSKKNKKVKVIQERGANIARGRNIAISKAKGEIIFASDAGCIIDKKWINNTIRYFPSADIVAGSYTSLSKNNFEFFQGQVVIKKVTRPSRMSSRNIAFKKKCWKEVGGYPEKSLTGEDTRFNINLIEKGYKIAINPQPLVSWEMRPTLFKFAKQFYIYGKGDRVQKNLLKKSLKRNLIMVFGFWAYLLLLISLIFVNPLIFFIILLSPLLFSILYSVKYLLKTRKISAIFWIPILIITKRISYILGVTFE